MTPSDEERVKQLVYEALVDAMNRCMRDRPRPEEYTPVDLGDYEIREGEYGPLPPRLADWTQGADPALDKVRDLAAVLHELELGCHEHAGDDSIYAVGSPHIGQAHQLLRTVTAGPVRFTGHVLPRPEGPRPNPVQPPPGRSR